MATHDYIISNQSGAAVRADLNNALAAIVSNNSNATSPATTYAFQWWADTTTGQLKLRNSANSAWITIFELDGTMLMEDGTVSAPGLAFASDLNTGFFRSAADKINFATGGAERLEIGSSEVVFNDPSNDVDFRVESNGNANMLFVDAGNDRVGVGIGTPTSVLDIRDTQTGAASEIKLFNLDQGNTTTQTSALVMTPDLRANGAKIAVVKEIADFSSTANKDVAITFSPVLNNTAVEAARIDSNGNLGVGTSSPTGFIHVEGTSTGTETYGRFTTGSGSGDQSLVIKSGSSRDHMAIQVSTNAGVNDDLSLQPDGGNVGIGTASPATALHVSGSGTQRIRITGTGTANAILTLDAPSSFTNYIEYGASASTPLAFYDVANTSERMRIDSSGNVGIGVSSPSQRLQVSSTGSGIQEVQWLNNAQAVGADVGAGLVFTGTTSNNGLARIVGAFQGSGTGDGGYLKFDTRAETSGALTERMRIDRSGVVKLTQSGSNPRFGSLEASGDAFKLKAFSGNSSHNATMQFFTGADSPTERMRITSGGNVLFNCTSLPSASVQGFLITGTTSGNTSSSGSSTTAYNHFLFYNGNGIVGSISTSGSTTTYSTSSDYRLKENVVDLDGAITRVKQLAPKRFNFIADDTATVDGFIAHEAQAVVPEAVTGTHNEVDDDGNAVMQGIDQSKLVPLLTAALKEAIAKIETLETKVATLEAG